MIWFPLRFAVRSKIFAGAASPSTLQWYTAVLVTMPSMVGDNQRQKTTLSGIWWDFIFDLSSMLKI